MPAQCTPPDARCAGGLCVQASQQLCGDGQDVESLKHRGPLITLKGPQWSQRFQWSQWFSGRAQVDEPVGEQAIEDWLRAIAIRPDCQDSLETRGWPRYAAREGEMAMPLLTTKLYVPRARADPSTSLRAGWAQGKLGLAPTPDRTTE